MPFVGSLGLNETSTRLPFVIYGMLTIILLYFIGKEIDSPSLGILIAFVAATMPWFIHYNRVGFELTSYCAFFTLTVLLFIKAAHHKSFIFFAFIFAALTFYTYQPAKLLIPLLIAGVLLIYRKSYFMHKRELVGGFIIFFIISIPLILSFFNGEGIARFNMVSVFSAKLSFSQIILRIIQNYFMQLSPSYFINGEPTFITRHFTGGLTPLLLTSLPFLVIGLINIFLTMKNKTSQFLLFWLFIYPIAGAVTAEAPFTSRSVIGAPLFAILISIGIATTVIHLKKFTHSYIITSVIIVVMVINLAAFTKFYFTEYPLYSSDFWGWQYGARDIVHYFSEHEHEYDDLIMAPEFNAPEIFFKFYAPHDCANCKIGLPDTRYNSAHRQLFALTPDYMNTHANFIYLPIKTLYYPNGKTAFIFAEIQGK